MSKFTPEQWAEYQLMLKVEKSTNEKAQEAKRVADLPENKIVKAIEALTIAISKPEVKDDSAIAEQVASLSLRLSEIVVALKKEIKQDDREVECYNITRDSSGRMETFRLRKI